MDKNNKKNELKCKIKNLEFNKRKNIFLGCGCTLVTGLAFCEAIQNNFDLYAFLVDIPITIGSLGVSIHAFKALKKDSLDLKKKNNEYIALTNNDISEKSKKK